MNIAVFIFTAAVAAGLAYWPLLGWREPSILRAIFKTLPVALLATASLVGGGPHFLTIALALSALGDWFLAFKGERNFIGGLVAFLLAHLAYCALFFVNQDPGWTQGAWFFAGAVLVMALVLGVRRVLRPHLGKMRIPVSVYCGVIAAMAVAALSRGPDPVLLAGVALFLASDMVLAFETFVFGEGSQNRRWSGPVIWYAYFVGQALIAATILFKPLG